MVAYYLKVSGRLSEEIKDGQVSVEKFGDVDEDDPSIRIL